MYFIYIYMCHGYTIVDWWKLRESKIHEWTSPKSMNMLLVCYFQKFKLYKMCICSACVCKIMHKSNLKLTVSSCVKSWKHSSKQTEMGCCESRAWWTVLCSSMWSSSLKIILKKKWINRLTKSNNAGIGYIYASRAICFYEIHGIWV